MPKPQEATPVSDTTSDVDTWGNLKTLQEHYEDHGSDFSATSPEDYANQANQFYQRFQQQNLPAVEGADGVIRVYDPTSNTFGSYNSDGTTRTFFKPPNGSAYFQEQIDTDLPQGGRIINPLPDVETIPELLEIDLPPIVE